MAAKKKNRGRPRTRPPRRLPGALVARFPFEELKNYSGGAVQRQALAKAIRRYRDAPPWPNFEAPLMDCNFSDARAAAYQDLKDWLSAAADALDNGCDMKAAHYLLFAAMCVGDCMVTALADLAAVGSKKLASDKRKGRRT